MLINEHGKHLVKVKEVWLRIFVVIYKIRYVIVIYLIHCIRYTDNSSSLLSSHLCHSICIYFLCDKWVEFMLLLQIRTNLLPILVCICIIVTIRTTIPNPGIDFLSRNRAALSLLLPTSTIQIGFANLNGLCTIFSVRIRILLL